MSNKAPDIIEIIKNALNTGKFDYTSNKSIRIYLLDANSLKQKIRMIEVEWKEIE